MDPKKGNLEKEIKKVPMEQDDLKQIIKRKKIQNKVLREMIDHLQQPHNDGAGKKK